MGSGKSRLAAELTKHISNSCIIKLADPLYALHNSCLETLRSYGWHIEPNTINRDLLQDIGLWGRKQDKDMWVKIARARINRILLEDPKATVICDDVRYANEFLGFADAFAIRLKASEECRKRRAQKWGNSEHESERGLDHFSDEMFDLVLDTEHQSIEENVEKCLKQLISHSSRQK
jgi:phosphomevalonate kinase